MCNGARYGVPQPVIIFPLSPFLFLSFLLPTPYFSSVEYASNAFFATWRHACVCCTQIFSMVAYFRHSPRAHLTSTGKKTGEKKGKKQEKNKKKNKMHCPSAHSLSLSAYLLVTVEVWFSRTTGKRRSSIDTPCPCADDTPGKSSGEHDSIKPEIN